MTVKMMIKQLMDFPMDAQVVDTYGSPVMYMFFHDRKSDKVRLKPKSQMDIGEELGDYFTSVMDTSMSDRDVVDELIEMGYTLDDLKEYNEDTYKWAKQYT